MIRRTFIKSLAAALALPFLPKVPAVKPATPLSPAHLAMKFNGRVNDLPFMGFAPHELLCEGVSAMRDEITGTWRVTFQLRRPNRRALWIPLAKADFSEIPPGCEIQVYQDADIVALLA